MIVTVTPTKETTLLEINGADVPARIWKGRTANGNEIVLFVLAVVPKDQEKWNAEKPAYFEPASDKMIIGHEEQH